MDKREGLSDTHSQRESYKQSKTLQYTYFHYFSLSLSSLFENTINLQQSNKAFIRGVGNQPVVTRITSLRRSVFRTKRTFEFHFRDQDSLVRQRERVKRERKGKGKGKGLVIGVVLFIVVGVVIIIVIVLVKLQYILAGATTIVIVLVIVTVILLFLLSFPRK